MKKTLIILLILIAGRLHATPELDQYSFTGNHITIDVIYRYRNDIKELYYETLTKNLDTYLDSLKQSGALHRGKLHFKIMTAIWMDDVPGIKMYRYKNGYYCWLNGLLQPITQEYLARIINYFSSDSWQSFCYDDDLITPKKAIAVFNKRIDTIKLDFKFKSKELFSLSSVTVQFKNDTLMCSAAKQDFGPIEKLVPFTSNAKDFFAIDSTLFVAEKNRIVNKITLSDNDFYSDDYYQCLIEKHPGWINFKNNKGYFLSYSLEQNKFYKL